MQITVVKKHQTAPIDSEITATQPTKKIVNNVFTVSKLKVGTRIYVVLDGYIRNQKVQSKIRVRGSGSTSTCFGKLFEGFFKRQMIALLPYCSEVAVTEGDETSWYPVECENVVYGIYYDEKTQSVKFHERIGMKQIKNILTMIGWDVIVNVNDNAVITEISIVRSDENV